MSSGGATNRRASELERCDVRGASMEEDHDDSSDGATDPDGWGDHVPKKGDVSPRGRGSRDPGERARA